MCSEAAVSELAFLTMCARCQDSAAECSTCTPPAVTLGEVPAQPEDHGDRVRGWCIEFRDTAAEMWDFR